MTSKYVLDNSGPFPAHFFIYKTIILKENWPSSINNNDNGNINDYNINQSNSNSKIPIISSKPKQQDLTQKEDSSSGVIVINTKHGVQSQLSKARNHKPGILSQDSKDGHSKPGIQAKGRTTWNPNQESQARTHIGKFGDFCVISYIPAQTGTDANNYIPHIYIYIYILRLRPCRRPPPVTS